MPSGLTAFTGHSIVSEPPILVSGDPTFRHIHKYLYNTKII